LELCLPKDLFPRPAVSTRASFLASPLFFEPPLAFSLVAPLGVLSGQLEEVLTSFALFIRFFEFPLSPSRLGQTLFFFRFSLVCLPNGFESSSMSPWYFFQFFRVLFLPSRSTSLPLLRSVCFFLPLPFLFPSLFLTSSFQTTTQFRFFPPTSAFRIGHFTLLSSLHFYPPPTSPALFLPFPS